MSECHCGEVILADTEEWDEPLCHKHYCEFIGNCQSQLKIQTERVEGLRKACEFYSDAAHPYLTLAGTRLAREALAKDDELKKEME